MKICSKNKTSTTQLSSLWQWHHIVIFKAFKRSMTQQVTPIVYMGCFYLMITYLQPGGVEKYFQVNNRPSLSGFGCILHSLMLTLHVSQSWTNAQKKINQTRNSQLLICSRRHQILQTHLSKNVKDYSKLRLLFELLFWIIHYE